MIGKKTEFQVFLENETNKVKGVYYPVKAGFLRRRFIRHTLCRNLHPNPYDEFCSPDIGPNDGIISKYVQEYVNIAKGYSDSYFVKSGATEPLFVQKTRPDGYMILNGHHRWAAAMRIGRKSMPIRIVDLTNERDVRKMLKTSTFSKRVTLDLDEVVFGAEGDANLEKPLPFPLNRIYRERLRLGIPALFLTLKSQGYDIWIYTTRYYSLDYLRYYFRHYRVRVTGIVTGTARKAPPGSDTMGELKKMMEKKYHTTLHIDNRMVLQTSAGSKEYQEFSLSGEAASWSGEIMDVLQELKTSKTEAP